MWNDKQGGWSLLLQLVEDGLEGLLVRVPYLVERLGRRAKTQLPRVSVGEPEKLIY